MSKNSGAPPCPGAQTGSIEFSLTVPPRPRTASSRLPPVHGSDLQGPLTADSAARRAASGGTGICCVAVVPLRVQHQSSPTPLYGKVSVLMPIKINDLSFPFFLARNRLHRPIETFASKTLHFRAGSRLSVFVERLYVAGAARRRHRGMPIVGSAYSACPLVTAVCNSPHLESN